MSEQARQEAMSGVRSLVVKLGTNVLADARGRLDRALVERIADEVHDLKGRGLRVAVVSSGAIGAGLGDLGLEKRPAALPDLQACAAVGQTTLMRAFDQALQRHGRHAAQVLLTRGDIEDRSRYLNVRNCIGALQAYGAVPIINENDTVSVDEIRFGDNDILAAMVANLLRADLLVLLTTVDGVYRDASRRNRFDVVEDLAEVRSAVVEKDRSALGVGGMRSKLEAVATVLAAGEMATIAAGPASWRTSSRGRASARSSSPPRPRCAPSSGGSAWRAGRAAKSSSMPAPPRPSAAERASWRPASRPSRARSRPATSSPSCQPAAGKSPRA
jgi:glutamate 5-kinase